MVLIVVGEAEKKEDELSAASVVIEQWFRVDL